MAGRFEGLTDVEWEVFQNIFPSEEQRGRGRPAAPSRNILNSLLYILIVGAGGATLREGRNGHQRASRHRRLKSWHHDGMLNEIKARLIGLAQNDGLIYWNSGAVDGSFHPWERIRC